MIHIGGRSTLNIRAGSIKGINCEALGSVLASAQVEENRLL